MLVLSRKDGECIRIGDDIIITVVKTAGDRVRIGIEAPAEKVILRSELKERLAKESENTEKSIIPFESTPHPQKIGRCS